MRTTLSEFGCIKTVRRFNRLSQAIKCVQFPNMFANQAHSLAIHALSLLIHSLGLLLINLLMRLHGFPRQYVFFTI